jgi:tripartite-type tricarboxylate transporter receptor subunit TctC
MKTTRRALVAAAFAAIAAPLWAQDYPTKNITLIVPFAAGGPTDIVGRLIAEKMSAYLGQEVLVENVGGAGGTLGSAQAATAAPDGYTILLSNISMASTAALYRNLPYDPATAFEPVGLITDVPMTIIARADFPPGDVPSLIAYVQENADTITMGNAGIGGASHLCGMLFQNAIEAPIVSVPYRGTGPAMTELLGGQIDMMCDQTTNTAEHIESGGVKAYAVTTPERLEILPDLPTTAESGLEGVSIIVWHGLYTPKGTPAEINERLSRALQTALADPDLAARLAELGTAPSPVADGTPAALKVRHDSEIARWRPIIEEAGIYAD